MTEPRERALPFSVYLSRRLAILTCGFGLAFLLSLLMLASFTIDQTIQSLVQLEATTLVNSLAEQPDTPLPRHPHLSAYRSWSELPAELRKAVPAPPEADAAPYEGSLSSRSGETEQVYITTVLDHQGRALYLVSHYSQAEMEEAEIQLVGSVLSSSVAFSLAVFLGLYLLSRELLRRTAEPLVQLGRWASNLSGEAQKPSPLSSRVQEVNELANKLRDSLLSAQQVNERERRFLRQASHELRTPLATVQASLDTLEAQLQTPPTGPLGRARKAGERMERITSALLWLSREASPAPPKEELDLKAVYKRLSEDYQKLLTGRDLSIRTDFQISTLPLHEELFSITLGNLLRNAIHHGTEGEITLQVSAESLRVSNPVSPDHSPEPGYGVGLELVRRIAAKSGWKFQLSQEPEHFTVELHWTS